MNNKSKYNPQIHHRRTIRLKGYDYSKAGQYFITICCKNRVCLFGKLWQRNYWEHIIRNEKSYRTISYYIINNPEKWYDDKFNSQV